MKPVDRMILEELLEAYFVEFMKWDVIGEGIGAKGRGGKAVHTTGEYHRIRDLLSIFDSLTAFKKWVLRPLSAEGINVTVLFGIPSYIRLVLREEEVVMRKVMTGDHFQAVVMCAVEYVRKGDGNEKEDEE